MLVDIIVFILIAVGIFKGMRKGLVVAVFSFLAFIIGLAAAIKLSAVVAAYLDTSFNISQRWLPVLAFIAVFILVVFLVKLGAKAIEGVMRVAMLSWLNRLGGVIFYVLLYIFIFSVLLFYAEQVGIIKPETMEASNTYGYIMPLGPKIIGAVGVVLPFFKNMFIELEVFFENISNEASS